MSKSFISRSPCSARIYSLSVFLVGLVAINTFCTNVPVLAKEQPAARPKIIEKDVERTIKFPDKSIGGLFVIPKINLGTIHAENEAAVARGIVELKVPAGSEILLRVNSTLLQNPGLLDTLAPDCIDCLDIKGAFFDLDDEQFANRLLLRVSKLSGLGKLRITALEPDDQGVAALKKLKKLTYLSITIGKINGSCLQDLQALPLLSHLDLSQNPIKSENLRYLAQFPALTHLELNRCKIDENSVKLISACRKLENINFSANSGIKDPACVHLAQMKNLQVLDLLETRVTAHGLAELKSLPHLRLLLLSPTCFTSQSLAGLKKILPSVFFDVQGISLPVSKDTNRIFAPITK